MREIEIREAFDELKALFPGERVQVVVEYNPTFKDTRYSLVLPDYTGVTADSIGQCLDIIWGAKLGRKDK